MQLQNITQNVASATAGLGQWLSTNTSALGQHLSNFASAASRTAAIAMDVFGQWLASAKSSLINGWNVAVDFTKTYTAQALDFAKAHPVGVGLGVAGLVLTATLAVAYDRSQRTAEA